MKDGKVKISGLRNKNTFLPVYTGSLPFMLYLHSIYVTDGGKEENFPRDVTEKFMKLRKEANGTEPDPPGMEEDKDDNIFLQLAQAMGGPPQGPLLPFPSFPKPSTSAHPSTSAVATSSTHASASAEATSSAQQDAEDNSARDEIPLDKIRKLRMVFGAVLNRRPTNMAPYGELQETMKIMTEAAIQERMFGHKLPGCSFDAFDFHTAVLTNSLKEITRQADRVLLEYGVPSPGQAPKNLPEKMHIPEPTPVVRYVPGRVVFPGVEKVDMKSFKDPYNCIKKEEGSPVPKRARMDYK